CVLALVAAGCSSGGQSQAPTITGRSGEQAAWQPIANGLDSPLGISSTPSEPNRLYIVEQPGLVRVLDGGKLLEQPFLDIRDQVVSGGEQGLLSLAFDPDYATNHLFYVDYTDTNGDTRV